MPEEIKDESKVEGERNFWTEVDWRVFTSEEKQHLQSMAKEGNWQNLASVLHDMRPEQEYQLAVLIDCIKPEAAEIVELETEKELQKLEMQGKQPIQTPEDEARWQKKIDKEKADKKQARQEQKKSFMENKKREIKK